MLKPQFVLPLSSELVIDLFAGGGGASTGIEQAIGRHVDIAINHDPEAVALHQANHPQTLHYVSDVFEVDPVAVVDGRAVGMLWASPDCKHFSKAKGGKPVSKRIRGLAWVVIKWAKLVRPRVIFLENVEEFQTWGPLGANNMPCPRRKGRTFLRWKRSLENLGYRVDFREDRASDLGTPTIRKRLFLVARCDGSPIVFPAATHGAPDSLPVKQKKLKPFRTAAECIQWDIGAPSIFERTRELADATKRRIAKGIMRYVVESANPFIVPLTHQGGDRVEAIDKPFMTVTGANRGEKALIVPTLVQTGYGEREGQAPRALDLHKPLGTVVAAQKHALVTAFLNEHAQASGQRVMPIDEPMRTQCAEVKGGHFGLVSATLVGEGGPEYGGKPKPVDEPLGTLTAENHKAIVTATLEPVSFEDWYERTKNLGGTREEYDRIYLPDSAESVAARHYAHGVAEHLQAAAMLHNTTGHAPSSPESPLPTVTTGGQHAVIAASLVKHYTGVVGSDLADPMGTVTAVDHHSLLTANLVHYNADKRPEDVRASSVEDPLKTQTTENRHALVTAALVGVGGRAGQSRPRPMDEPTATATSKYDTALATAHLVHMGHGEGAGKTKRWSDGTRNVEEPLNTVTASSVAAALVTSNLIKLRGTSKQGQSVEEPLHTITGGGLHHAEVRAFLIKYYGTDQDPKLSEPLHTVTTKDRFGLVTIKGQAYQIVDIGLRMLTPRELYRAQGFPESYQIERGGDGRILTKTAQVRMCGNSVCPPMAYAYVKANYSERQAVFGMAAA